MDEDIALYLEAAQEGMDGSITHLKKELVRIRSGRATPDMLQGIMVDYYGSATPINQVANVKTQDARTLVIAPWEKKVLQNVEQAIFQANIGVTPQNDGEVIRLVIPPLTEERRKQLVKQSGTYGEQAKVSIRSARRDAMEEIKQAVKDGYSEDAGKDAEEKVQNLTNKYTKLVDTIMAAKEKELITM
ncbi:MAG: ribosome recycling factor [Aureispira sp.]|nr:ribosome recycling factor [Aureispira sp.]